MGGVLKIVGTFPVIINTDNMTISNLNTKNPSGKFET